MDVAIGYGTIGPYCDLFTYCYASFAVGKGSSGDGGNVWGRSIVGCRGSRIAATNVWVNEKSEIAMLHLIDLLRGDGYAGIFRGVWAKFGRSIRVFIVGEFWIFLAQMLLPYN
ncbi:MAG: hypothetical protein D6728_21205 [Cyanobacteria bacterium J055]|nr:MAG: hypothetical protein D6728_21205 [Cyanobacteria bacterium J055]